MGGDADHLMVEDLLQEADQANNAGDREKALQCYSQALELCGKEESQVSNKIHCLQQLVQIYAESNQYAEAIPLYKELISLFEKYFSPDYADIIGVNLDLARAYESTDQFDLADEEYKLAIAKAERLLGLSDPKTQEIREEYFDVIASRQLLANDQLTHGIVFQRASQNITNSTLSAVKPTEISDEDLDAASESQNLKVKDVRLVRKYPNLSQATTIKRLRYTGEVGAHPAALLKPNAIRRHWRDLSYLISVLLCLSVILFAFSKVSVNNELPDNNLIAQRLIGSVYRSVDGFDGIHFLDNKYATLLSDVHHRKIPYFLLKGGMRDLQNMIVGMLVRRENWYQLNQDELTTEHGNIYYASDAPELAIAKKMENLSNFAKSYYAKNGCYPDKVEKLKEQPGLAYINPFQSKAELPVIRRLSASYSKDVIFPGLKPEATESETYAFLRSGGLWHDDLQGDCAGKISALALFSSQRCADGYRVVEFYIHGFDRHGQLITAGKPETYYAVGFSLGKSLNDDNKERLSEVERASVHPPDRIYITPGYVVDVHFLRQILSSLLGGSVLVSFAAWFFLESKRRREQPKRALQPIELILLVCFSIWAYVTFIRILP